MEAIAAVLPWLAGWLVLTDGGKQTPAQGIEQFGSAITKGPANVAFQYYIIGGLIFLAAGFAIYKVEAHDAEKHGRYLEPPPVAPGGLVAPPPQVQAASGFGFQRAGIGVSQGLGVGGASAPLVVPEGPRSSPERGAFERAARYQESKAHATRAKAEARAARREEPLRRLEARTKLEQARSERETSRIEAEANRARAQAALAQAREGRGFKR